MTKTIALSLALAASFSLAACTSEPTVDNNATTDNMVNVADDTMNAAVSNDMGNNMANAGAMTNAAM